MWVARIPAARNHANIRELVVFAFAVSSAAKHNRVAIR
jgi:hypothetical protein